MQELQELRQTQGHQQQQHGQKEVAPAVPRRQRIFLVLRKIDCPVTRADPSTVYHICCHRCCTNPVTISGIYLLFCNDHSYYFLWYSCFPIEIDLFNTLRDFSSSSSLI